MHPPEIAAMVRIAPSLGLAVLLAACTPSAPDKEQPPEPKAAAATRHDGALRGMPGAGPAVAMRPSPGPLAA